MQAKVSTPSDAPPPKKKAKKNKEQQVSSDPSWSWDSVRAGEDQVSEFIYWEGGLNEIRPDWSKFLHSQYPPAPSLLFAYTTLRGALLSSLSTPASPASIYEDKEASVCRIADAIIRAVEAVHAFLFETSISNTLATATSSSTPLPSSSCVLHGGRYENLTSNRIATSSTLLMYTLHTAFPALLHASGELTSLHDKHRRETVPLRADGGRAQGPGLGAETGDEQVDRVLDVLLELILLPLVRAFRPLCRTRLVPLCTPGTTSGAQASASAKVNPPASTAGSSSTAAKQTGAKEASEEKEKGKKGKSKASLNSKETPTFPSDSDPAPARAVNDIRKDTLALLGTTLGVLLANSAPSTTSTPAHSGLHKTTCGIRERVALEAIRELEALYGICREDDSTSLTCDADRANSSSGVPAPALASSQHHAPSTTTTTATTADRSVKPQGDNGTPRTETVGRNAKTSLTAVIKHGREAWRADIFQTLVTKDAAWYLCSVLHLAVVSSESRTSADEEAISPSLMRAVIEGVGRLLRLATPDVANIDGGDGLVRRFEVDHRDGDGDKSGSSERQQSAPGSAAARAVIDPVTQNMLLAICEKAMCGYAEIDPDLVE